MSSLAQDLTLCDSPFLVGFGQRCLDENIPDEQVRAGLKQAAAAFPAVRAEMQSVLEKRAVFGTLVGLGRGALSAGSKLLGRGVAKAGPKALSAVSPAPAPAAAGGVAPAVQAAPKLLPAASRASSVSPASGVPPISKVMPPSASAAAAPGSAGPIPGGAAPTVPPTFAQRLGTLTPPAPLVRGALGGAYGALQGAQDGGGISGALTEGAIGAAIGAKAPSLGVPAIGIEQMAPQFGMNLSPGQNVGRGLTGAGRYLGIGGPTFRQEIGTDVNDLATLQQRLDAGAQELRDAGQSWQDHEWSGGSFGKQISEQRSKLYQQYRQQARALGVPQQEIDQSLQQYTPQPTNFSNTATLATQLQDSETRQLFKTRLGDMEAQVAAQIQSGNGVVDENQLRDLMTSRAVVTALENGQDPKVLAQRAASTVQKILNDGQIAPEEAAQLAFQSEAGKEFLQDFAQQIDAPADASNPANTGVGGALGGGTSAPGQGFDPMKLLQDAAAWMTENPLQTGLLALGVPMALWGGFSMLGGDGGMGSFMALLGGLGLMAGGAGVFGGADVFGLRQAGQPPAENPPAPPPPANTTPQAPVAPQAGSLAQHYGTQVTDPAALQRLYAQFTQDPATKQLGRLINTPEELRHFVTTYNNDPAQARQWLFNEIPAGLRAVAGDQFDAGWQQISKRLNGPYANPAAATAPVASN